MGAEVKKLEPTSAANIGGLIDGEGTVTLTRLHANERRRLAVCIANTDRKLLEFVLMEIGAGKITGKKAIRLQHTPSYCYAIFGRQALALLRQVSPYLRTYKRTRADLVLRDYVRLTPRNGKYGRLQSEARRDFEIAFFQIGFGNRRPKLMEYKQIREVTGTELAFRSTEVSHFPDS